MNPQKSQSAFREHTKTHVVVSKQCSHEVKAASKLLAAETLQCHDLKPDLLHTPGKSDFPDHLLFWAILHSDRGHFWAHSS